MSEVAESYNEDEIVQNLRFFTLDGAWEDVVEIYENYPLTHTAWINTYQDTALHIAADIGQEETVKQLLDAILKYEDQGDDEYERDSEINEEEGGGVLPRALTARNVEGDTPLHLAASRGYANSCNCIAKVDRKLLDIRNNNGETPLFLAGLNWNRDAFLLLYFWYFDDGQDVQLPHFRRNDGDTVMHVAIKREYFDLAILLTQLRRGVLVGFVNEKGKTCLDILATKPSAFKSSTSLSWWKEILYCCIHVPKLGNQIVTWKKEIKMKYTDTKVELTKEKNKKCYNIATSIWRKAVPGSEEQATTDIENSEISQENKDKKANTESSKKKGHKNVQWNWCSFYEFAKEACLDALQYLGKEFIRTKNMKERHVWAAQIMEEYKKHGTLNDGTQPFGTDACEKSKLINLKPKNEVDNQQETQNKLKDVDTPFLEAGKRGILEIVDLILTKSPTSLYEKTIWGKKNIVLVAVENKQPKIVKRLKQEKLWNNLILGKDTEDNTILHLAAKASTYKPWRIPGSAMQMLWDIKWYQYVKELGPKHMPFQINKNGKTPGEVFSEEHKDLVKESSEWLKDTSNSCSIVAALIAGVSFAASNSVPGGTNEQGKAPLEGQPAFGLFAVSSVGSLCFSITALIMFLSILTSRKQAKDFRKDLPIKLLLGLSSLFLAIASTLVAFCSANFFVLEEKFKNILFPIYAATCLPVSFYAVAQFPLYLDLIVAIFTSTPQRCDWKEDHL